MVHKIIDKYFNGCFNLSRIIKNFRFNYFLLLRSGLDSWAWGGRGVERGGMLKKEKKKGISGSNIEGGFNLVLRSQKLEILSSNTSTLSPLLKFHPLSAGKKFKKF